MNPDSNTVQELRAFFAPLNAQNNSWAEQTLRQIEKDFTLQGLEITLPTQSPGYLELIKIIASKLQSENMLEKKQMIGLLYQMDINEKSIKRDLDSKEIDKGYTIIAEAMIKRCFTKVYLRNTLK